MRSSASGTELQDGTSPVLEAGGESAGGSPTGASPVRVLYIAGTGRSGSTLVDRILGQLDGFFSAGELRYLWQRGVLDNRLCGCGEPFGECPTWQAILDRAAAGPHERDIADVATRQRARIRLARLPALLTRTGHARRSVCEPDDALLADVYRSTVEHTSARVLVDSSKLPSYGYLVSRLPGVELFVLHIVRDPRATAYSWTRSRALPDFQDERLMQQQSTWKSALLWLVWNTLTELFWGRKKDYVRIRYEDFVRSPEETIRHVADVVDGPLVRSPFRSPTSVQLGPTHSVAGNPSRHRVGPVDLQSDLEWVHAMPLRQRMLVTALTWPWLLRYGYPLRPTRSSTPRKEM